MNLTDWIPAISTTSLLAGALWLMRSLIIARLTKSVQHEYDGKLEVLRSDLRRNEETFKAELRAKDAQIELLRSGVISGLASRQAALDKRRIEAVDQLWSAVVALAPAKTASTMMATIKFDAASKDAAKNPQFRQIFEVMGGAIDLNKIGGANASQMRPFVSEMSWAIFSAYQAIIMFAILQLQMLKVGLDAPNVLNTETVSKLVKAVLPHQTKYIEKYGVSGCHYLLDELEVLLLNELRSMLKGEESDKASLEQAAVILKESKRLMDSIANAESKA